MASNTNHRRPPVLQRHGRNCTRTGGCDCPWTARVRLPDGTHARVRASTYDGAVAAWRELYYGEHLARLTLTLPGALLARIDAAARAERRRTEDETLTLIETALDARGKGE